MEKDSIMSNTIFMISFIFIFLLGYCIGGISFCIRLIFCPDKKFKQIIITTLKARKEIDDYINKD
jgi:hypothetical protein